MGTRTHTYGRPVNTRRQFFGAVAAAVAAVGVALSEPGPDLNPVFRKTATGWERCRMRELKIGDTMKIVLRDTGGEVVVGRVTTDPVEENGHWQCVVEEATDVSA